MVTLAQRAARAPLAPVVAVMFGLVAAILVVAVPGWMFDRAVMDSGLPSILHYASPPLGLTARVIAAVMAFAVTASILWVVLAQVEKLAKKAKRSRTARQDEGYVAIDETVKVEGRRRPIFAPAELGAPLMSDEAIAQPPVAEPEPIFEPEPELEAPLSAVEFDLPPSDTPDDDASSIQMLIRRLEAGLARRADNDPGPDSPTSARSSASPEPDSPNSDAGAPLSLPSEWIIPANKPFDDESRDDMRQALGALSRFASR
ncbi:hypothetical protein BH09PSE3_BH09PSE3_01450 [soil metagenome]